MALAPVASAASYQGLILGNDNVSQFDAGTGSLVGSVSGPAGEAMEALAMAPDGRTAYATARGSDNEVVPFAVTTDGPVLGSAIVIPDSSYPGGSPAQPTDLASIAVAPDGQAAYVIDTNNDVMFPMDLTSDPPSVGAAVTGLDAPQQVLVSPDSSTVYVLDQDGILPVNAASGQPGTLIPVPGTSYSMALSPDGSTAYVVTSDNGGIELYSVDLSTGQGSGISLALQLVSSWAPSVVVTPDGKTAYVEGFSSQTDTADHSGVQPVNLVTGQAQSMIDLNPTGNGEPTVISITPDGKTVFAGTSCDGNDCTTGEMYPIATATNTAATPLSLSEETYPTGIALTPDQPPVPSFTVSSAPPGSATQFDASASTVTYGSITNYAWNFGDGTSVVNTAGPTTSHVYASAGTFTASVTETDSAGSTASASRSVVITGTGQAAPVFGASAAAVAFGQVGAGQVSGAQTLVVSNAGSAGLAISAVSLTGGQASQFRLGADSCEGQTVPAGGACSVSVQFAPTGPGNDSAAVTFADNASGSPHSVALTGTGLTTGTVAGAVVNGSTGGDPPVSGASVQICPVGTNGIQLNSNQCQYTTTGLGGTYSFTGLAQGAWAMEVEPMSSSLFGGSATLNVVPGPQAQNFTLQAPQPLPPGASVSISSIDSTTSSGVPTLYWNSPFTLDYPPDLPFESSGSETLYLTTLSVYPAGEQDDPGDAVVSGGLAMLMSYAKSGSRPTVVSQLADPHSGPNPTVTFTGTGGATQDARDARSGTKVARGGPLAHQADLIPDNVNFAYLENFQPLPPTGTVSAQVPSLQQKAHGPMTIKINQNTLKVPPGSRITIAPDGSIQVDLPCPNASDCTPPCATTPCQPLGPSPGSGSGSGGTGPAQNVTVNVYVDPSGEIRTTDGAPVPGARVVLERARTRRGPFRPVPDHSSIMSLANDQNPFMTPAGGLYHWDVLPGYYRIVASHPGCTAKGSKKKQAVSRVLPVPPPAFGVNLTLSCPHLTRVAARTALTARTYEKGRMLELVEKVTGARGHRPTGLVTFRAAGRTLATVPLDSKTHTALLAIPAAKARHYTATYSGDGYTQPATAGVQLRR